MPEDTTDPKKANKPRKKRYRTSIIGLIEASALKPPIDLSAIAQSALEMTRIVDNVVRTQNAFMNAALPYVVESDRDDFPGILIDPDPEASAPSAPVANAPDVAQRPPAQDRGPGEQRKPDPQSMPAASKPRATAPIRTSGPKRLTAKQRKLVENFYAVKDSIDFPGVGVWAGLQFISERHLHRLRIAYDRETRRAT